MDSIIIREHMNRQPVLLKSDMSIAAAVDMLLSKQCSGAPVVDDQHQAVGFLSEQDCLSALLKGNYHHELNSRVADIMRTDILSVSPDDNMVRLAEQMLGLKPKIYPVIENGKVIATISRNQVLRALNNFSV